MSVSEYAISEVAISESAEGGSLNAATLIRPRGNPAWTRQAAIGDIGGALDKRNSTTEGAEPYAAMLLRELWAMRGSAYSQQAGTLVDVENVALARFMAAVWFRTPEKARANETPLRADEKLGYHSSVLGVPSRSSDPSWRVRERCVAISKIAQGPTLPVLEQALSSLLGDAFVSVAVSPANTFTVNVIHPPSMDRAEFLRRVYVEAHELLDTSLVGWADFSFTES